MEQVTEHGRRRVLYFILTLLVLLMLFFIQLLDFGSKDASEGGQNSLPISIRASSQADYSQGTSTLVVPPVNENIFQQIIMDLQGTGSPEERASTLEVSLSMPVPTMTLNPLIPTSTLPPSTPTVAASATPQASITSQVTGTVQIQATPTSTIVYATPSPSASALTPVTQPTKKPKPTQRPRPTKKP